MYTTYSQHFFFCFGFLYQIVTTTTTTSILNQIYPSYFFFSYTQYILHYLLIGFIEEVFKECNDNLLNSYIYIQIVVNNSFIYFFFFCDTCNIKTNSLASFVSPFSKHSELEDSFFLVEIEHYIYCWLGYEQSIKLLASCQTSGCKS